MSDHEKYLNEALKLAAKGLGRVAPNPLVGALLVRNGRIVGRGWHQDYGGLHAEANAIKDAGEKARGATLYCTLEPCNHQGKQPPCSQAVIDAGISQVILGALDPNPIAAGGIGTLTASGVAVVTGVHEERCAAINAPFFKRVASGLPYVTLKWAMTLDGKIATHSGDSKWVTSEPAREFSHRLRACHDAILVGVGTVLADKDGSAHVA
jgi:diaminohydroxyphosphoribosylaminopyrimidine deaminase / 5-amino-6-(5-phosphoribosylamino)uracil reductase